MFLNPPVLLMDEPFSALDHGTKQAIYTHFQAWQAAEPRMVILVTHDWEEAKQLADAFTDIFPSADLSINGQRVVYYRQPLYPETHGLFTRPAPTMYQRQGINMRRGG